MKTTTHSKAGWIKTSAWIMYWLYPVALFATLIIKDYSEINFSYDEGSVTMMILALFMVVFGIIAVILAYAVRQDAKGTYLANHFRAHIYSFWIGLLLSLLGFFAYTYSFKLGLLFHWCVMLWLSVRFAAGLKTLKSEQPMKVKWF